MANIEPRPALGSLPDLTTTVQSLRALSIQAEQVANFPAFDQGAQILAALHQLQQGVAAVQQNMAGLHQNMLDLQQGQADILERIQHLEDESSHQDQNNIARAINSTVPLRSGVLEPFYGLNGQLIVGFPRGNADIERLNGDGINALLVALGLGVAGTVAARKERFSRYIGFVAGMD
ncbi:hypothetical protein L873DRAFT_1821073 [Choiromyces venosus 120613-1]|uniref:Uncharacterized protein n=1 Tax=Choiromyces venosus 120613-1 TaxID=1336337 RepID=A0A3N4IXB9_9PEZI|nr:hypothetical protein L873DRAFT_1821073 [Choiromyces venosus 120613-1]